MATARAHFEYRWLYPVPALLFVGAWYLITYLRPELQFLLSSPAKVGSALFSLVLSGQLFWHTTITAIEAISGFLLGSVVGALVGLGLWYRPVMAALSRPYIVALGSVPVFALAPVLILWFGIGLTSKIIMAALSTVIVALIQAYQGAQAANESHLRLLFVLGATRRQVFQKVIVPSSLIWVINSMKLNIGLALLGAFLGEFISSEQGLGYLIIRASGLYDMATVFVGCIALALLALGLSVVVSVLERRLLRWNFPKN